jgi:hypothetical protein
MPNSFDHAADNVRRRLEPLTYTFGAALESHMLTPLYGLLPQGTEDGTSNLMEYHSTNALWSDNIRADKHYHGCKIKLDGFFLFEWFPRSPGLYFTENAFSAREEAKNRIIGIKSGVVTYNPYGKQSMLDGGVGNVRLAPLEIGGQTWFFMSASDNGVCHQGFPVAIPAVLYQKCIDEIRGRGAAARTLIGELKLIPKHIQEVYVGYTGVKKFYLEVDNMYVPKQLKSRTFAELDVSVAVSFKGTVDEADGIYASYVTFNPAKQGSLKGAVQWMNDEYITSYKGMVLTDFDEQENHFPYAEFSLQKVMKFQISENSLLELQKNNNIYVHAEHLIQIQRFIKTQYEIQGGNIGAVGDNAQASDVKQFSTTQQGDPAPAEHA